MIVNPNVLPRALEAARAVDPDVNTSAVEKAVEAALDMYRNDTDADLATRMTNAGMSSIDHLLSTKNPINHFMGHAGVNDLSSFERWLEMRHREFMHMRVKYEIGDEKEDELYEWVLAHSGALGEVIVNFRKATGNKS
jgi:hypothetical protein